MYFLHFFQDRDLALQAAVQPYQAPVQLHQAPVQHHQAPVQHHPAPVQHHQAENRIPIICVRQTRVNSIDELEIGDHLVFHRSLYDHHGILTEKHRGSFQVAEAAKTDSESTALIKKVKLQLSWKTLESEEGGVSVATYLNRITPKPNTAIRALQLYDESTRDPTFYQYNLFSNNCEHFATYCSTGKMYSLQVEDFRSRALPSYIKERLRSRITGENEQGEMYRCIPCENIENENDVNKGDIIEYFENDIWHHALVIDTLRHTPNDVICSVVHCKSCASSSGRKIKKEDIVITFNKLFYKLNFELSGFDIYGPDDTVKNARKQFTRQMADSLTNACSQFPIWCKLKL